MTQVTLNQTEQLVLQACIDEADSCSDGDFGEVKDVYVEGITEAQMKGYISQLSQKGFIKLWEVDDYPSGSSKCFTVMANK